MANTQASSGSNASQAEATAIAGAAPRQETRAIAIACQGGGAQAAYTGGVASVLLDKLLGPRAREDDPTKWVGISGTSGGAITALVAWYGALLGGREEAQALLRQVWEHNTAQLPGEVWINEAGVRTLDLFRFDFQLNPYIAPLAPTVEVLTKLWPAAAGWFPPFAAWVRPDYFRFEALVGRFVDFDVVAALGHFLSIPDKIGDWQASGVMDALLDGNGLQADGSRRPSRHGLRDMLLGRLAQRKRLQAEAAAHPEGLLAEALAQWSASGAEREVAAIERRLAQSGAELDDAELDAIRAHVKTVRGALPLLLLGAVNVTTGEFVAFSSKRPPDQRGITLDAVRASAAIPWIFRGVEIPSPDAVGTDIHVYWDGLFSQNPPVADFFAGVEPDEKPDEIWVAQVNPQRSDTRDIDERLWDRRNELAGNLSLNQEIAFAGAINARIAGDSDDKYVQILRIAMDSDRIEAETGRSLGPASKLDRSAVLMDELFAHGVAQAEVFVPVREAVELTWNRPGAPVWPSLPIEGLPPGGIADLRKAFGRDLRFQISDLTLEKPPARRSDSATVVASAALAPNRGLGGDPFPGEAWRARLSWQCRIQGGEHRRGRLEGMAVVALNARLEPIGARMTNVTLVRPDVVPLHAAPRTLPKQAA